MTTRTRVAQGLAGAAVLVAAVTVVSRVVGFGRWLVFSRTVGTNCLSEAYNTANQLPNIVFEIVAGGALASVTVPLLAGPLARGAREEAEHVASALLTWALAVLTPLAVLGMLVARPFAALLFDTPADCAEAAFLPTVARMLLVFLPQWCSCRSFRCTAPRSCCPACSRPAGASSRRRSHRWSPAWW
ncbi:lipid II flippase MurJ [Carbonactinospora thermoautotrophica]|uniref:lipid II flippase MurJ n=1 Tax=Carbonactinospora thermoautotrophica TaxID=1469144 RepID=UPI003DA88FF6